jgi:hypothetical protein
MKCAARAHREKQMLSETDATVTSQPGVLHLPFVKSGADRQ